MPEIARKPKDPSERCILSGALDQLDDAIIVLDKDGHVAFVNRAAERIVGRQADALVDHVLWREMPSLGGEIFQRECCVAMETVLPRRIEEYDSTNAKWLELRLYP